MNRRASVSCQLQGWIVAWWLACDRATGALSEVQAAGWGNNLVDESYRYDPWGNRIDRNDGLYDQTESYLYDDNNRLTQAVEAHSDGNKIIQWTTLKAHYDPAGNFNSKTTRAGQINYGYAGGDADKLASISGHFTGGFAYDAAGRITAGPDGLSAAYNARGLATVLHKQGHVAELYYAPDGQRYESVLDATTTEYYAAGGAFKVLHQGGVSTYREAIVVGGVMIAQLTTRSNATGGIHYFYHDALGSIIAVTDGSAANPTRLAYGPFGRVRAATNWASLLPPSAIEALDLPTRRGYTGGEALTALGLVHLGARIYDPSLGRWLSPDPAGASTPYVYVGDNPLSDTDPNGALDIGQILTIAALVALSVVSMGALAPLMSIYLASMIVGAGMGFIGGMIASNGNLHAGLMGALGGAVAGVAFAYLGSAIPYSSGVGGMFEKAGLEGFAGGALSDVEGGSFRDGFLGAFVSSMGGDFIKERIPGKSQGAIMERTAATAALAGTASKLTGGSFANGAETAAFLQLFADAARYFEHNVGGKATLAPGKNPNNPYYPPDKATGQQPAWSRGNNVFGNNGPGHLCSQGSVCSRIFNLVPGLNGGVARLHDYWLNSMEVHGLHVTTIDNIGTMLPAAVVGYAAIIGTPLQTLSTQQIIYLSIASSSSDRDDRRRIYYYGAAIGVGVQ